MLGAEVKIMKLKDRGGRFAGLVYLGREPEL